ncbi:MAG: restriction endonuclease subunit S [Firmicutes bacterium]|nr:restriction endonuclease subunit S [Bacillota bacterium]
MTKLIEITGKALSGEWGTDDEVGNGIPVLRTTNFTNEGVVNYDNVVTRTITKKNIAEKYLRTGDIIIEKSGGSDKQPVGRVIYFDGSENTFLFNNFTGLLRVKDQNVWVPKYVFYSLFANYRKGGTRPFENKTTGLHNLKTDDYVSRYVVNDATYNDQINICSNLDRIWRIIQLKKEELEKLDELIKARFVEMFGDAVDNPMGWPTKELQELVTDDCTISYGIVQTGDDQDFGVPVFRPVDIVNHTPVRGELKKTTEEISNKYKRTILKGRELLITVRANIADTCIVGEEFTGCNVGRGIVPIRTKEDEITLEFLKHQLDSKHLNDNIKSKAKGITLIQLNMEDLRTVILMVPPIERQKAFMEFAKQVDKSKAAVQRSLDESQLLFDSLMQKYFG